MNNIVRQPPKLWEEYYDPIELERYDDYPIEAHTKSEDFFVVDFIIQNRLSNTQRDVMNTYISYGTYKDLNITEKAFRYSFNKALKTIKSIVLDKPHLYKLKSHINQKVGGFL